MEERLKKGVEDYLWAIDARIGGWEIDDIRGELTRGIDRDDMMFIPLISEVMFAGFYRLNSKFQPERYQGEELYNIDEVDKIVNEVLRLLTL